ncbi:hypothetical protein VB711_21300 [Cronbergia sp. UHCC 0137]|uniref:hypothetical protein n=1 Tax=Cronbergia sp. UHCC 0137 TaxID=3110239 RepID=UPI002B2209E4|nr:hypothetical protein [Cronbergia sp. UHCC 0137]MEA5620361.1 hypothetical protein [Cronbergia sp. UHCC 0137]
MDELEILAKPHYQRRGKPKLGDEVSYYTYHIQGNLVENETVINIHLNQAGRFILATNLLDEEKWTNDMILHEYKEKQTTKEDFA